MTNGDRTICWLLAVALPVVTIISTPCVDPFLPEGVIIGTVPAVVAAFRLGRMAPGLTERVLASFACLLWLAVLVLTLLAVRDLIRQY